jgi:outer membrane protein assembly factor BamB
MPVRHCLALSLAGLLFGCALAAGANWPRFRGPNGTGVASDKDVPVQWTAQDVLWKAPLPGGGHSSPIVWGNRVFVEAATASERMLACLDADKGKVVWTKKVPGKRGKTHTRSSLASSTPCTDGERVYAIFWDGSALALHAYDFAGREVWHKDLGRFKSQHGPGLSPVVHDGKVFVNNDQDGSAVLLAFDARTGKEAWQGRRPAYRACYSTPFLYEPPGGDPQLIVTSTTRLSGYDPKTGDEIWHFTWSHPGMPLRTVGSAIAADGLLIVAAGDGSGDRGMIAVKLGGKGDVSRTNLVWEKNKARATPYVPTNLARNGHLYTINDDGWAVCYETKTGKEAWRAKLPGPVSGSPILVDGKVFAVTERGEVAVYDAKPTGFKLLARNSFGELSYSTPAVADGKLYIRGSKHLFCIGRKGKP